MKKTLAILLALALVFSSVTVAFAEETLPADAKAITTLGMLTGAGNGVTLDYLKTAPTRIQAALMVLRLKGLDDEAMAFTGTDNFADADKQAWAKPIMAYLKAHPEVGFAGVGNNNFDPTKEIDAQSYYKVMLETLGYKANTAEVIGDFVWANVFEFAAKQGLSKVANVLSYTVNDLATATVETLKANVAGSTTKTLAASLVETKVLTAEKAIAAGVYTAPVLTLAVDSVSALNARQVEVKFNKAVDAATLIAANIKVYYGSSTTATTWSTKTVTNDQTVVLGMDSSVPQDTDVKVVVKDVVSKANANEKLAEVTKTVRMKDVTAPTVYTAAATTSKTITVATSEPMDLTGLTAYHVMTNVTIDGVKLVGKLTTDYSKNETTIELGTGLAVGSHSIVIDGLKDIVGFTAPKFEGTVVIFADAAAPEIVKIEAATIDSVKVTFNEPVQTLGTVTIKTVAYTTGVQSADKKSFTIALTTPLNIASLIRETVSYVGTVDMEGNTVTTAKTFDFVATDDLTVPTAAITVKSNNNIEITYSEEMSDPGKLTIKKADGTVTKLNLVPTLDSTKKIGTITAAAAGFDTATSVVNYTLELTAAKDNSLRQNDIAKTTVTAGVYDITPPQIVAVVLDRAYAAGPPVVLGRARVYFNEAMDTTTLTDLRNYLVDFDGAGAGAAVQLSSITDAAATVAADAKSVLLTIPGSTFAGATTTVSVLGVKDAIGTLVRTADFNVAKTVTATATALTVSSRELVATNKVKVVFNQAISTVDPSEFKVFKADGTTLAFVGVAYELDSAKTGVTVTLNGNVGADGKVAGDTTAALIVVGSATAATKDVFNQSANFTTPTALVDKVAPTFVKVEKHATLANTLVMTFTEAVYEAAADNFQASLLVKDTDGVVLGYGSTDVAVAGLTTKTVTLTFSGSLLTAIKAADGDATIKIAIPVGTNVDDLTGVGGNVLAPVADTSVVITVDQP